MRRGSFSKTWTALLRSTIGESFSKTLRRQGMMLGGACCPLEMWALPIFASGSGCSQPTPERLWPTPTQTDAVRFPSKNFTTPNITLNHAVVMWATPTTRDHKSGKASQATHDRNSRPLSEQVGDLLSPTWVEWLMGWPIDWTDPDGGPSSEDFQEWLESNRTALIAFVGSATVRFHSPNAQHGSC